MCDDKTNTGLFTCVSSWVCCASQPSKFSCLASRCTARSQPAYQSTRESGSPVSQEDGSVCQGYLTPLWSPKVVISCPVGAFQSLDNGNIVPAFHVHQSLVAVEPADRNRSSAKPPYIIHLLFQKDSNEASPSCMQTCHDRIYVGGCCPVTASLDLGQTDVLSIGLVACVILLDIR